MKKILLLLALAAVSHNDLCASAEEIAEKIAEERLGEIKLESTKVLCYVVSGINSKEKLWQISFLEADGFQGCSLLPLYNDKIKKICDAKITKNIEEKKLILKPIVEAEIKYLYQSRQSFFNFKEEKRKLSYLDDQKNVVLTQNYDKGSMDVKKDLNSINPKLLLAGLKKVKECGYFISPYLLPFNFLQIQYVKKELIYNNDGTTMERVTLRHSLVQTTRIALGLGLSYSAYRLLRKIL